MTEEAAKALREPFPESSIGKLPKAGIQLDYVGHAAVTDRLLAVDPLWSWEPVAYDPTGAPLVTERGKDAVLWIRLTVCGVTRLGVGIVASNAFELEKQLISDALRNAAMRFGVALDLWAKENLGAEDEPPAQRLQRVPTPLVAKVQRERLKTLIADAPDPAAVKAAWAAAGLPRLDRLTVDRLDAALAVLDAHDIQVEELPQQTALVGCPHCGAEISAENPVRTWPDETSDEDPPPMIAGCAACETF